jgi:hypothetical protein
MKSNSNIPKFDPAVADRSDPAIFSIADPNENAKSEVIQ